MKNHINIADVSGTPLIIKDYLTGNKSLKNYYNRSFSADNLLAQSKEKLALYTHRQKLTQELNKQLTNLELSKKQTDNLHKLSLENTVTITTGHQLNLMTGPLYFIYKILHVIKLCDSMNAKQQEINFVPVFWMATEDHDFEEINHFYFQNNKFEWKENYNDFVGEIPTSELKNTLSEFYEELKYFPRGKELRNIIEKSYFKEKNLAEATKVLVHELFKEYGLLFIDGNSPELKKLFIPYVKDDLINQKSFHLVSEVNNDLQKNYKIQVNPREINFFYHENHERNRVDKINNLYYILGTEKKFTEEEILLELEKYPEKFSPNALMRPVYQETILPNVAYIGGNAEIAYWLELKKYFNTQNIPFPILIPRNSFFIINQNQEKKRKKYQLEYKNLLEKKDKIIEDIVGNISDISFDYAKYENRLNSIFDDLLQEAKDTDPTWKNMILAQQKKQLNGLQKINHRFYKAERLKHKDTIANFNKFYLELFPNGTWQERVENFSFYYAVMNQDFFSLLYSQIYEYQSTISFINIQN